MCRSLSYFSYALIHTHVYVPSAPTTSPRFGMGACHLGGSRFTETNLFIEDSFSPGIRSVLGAARQFFSITTAVLHERVKMPCQATNAMQRRLGDTLYGQSPCILLRYSPGHRAPGVSQDGYF